MAGRLGVAAIALWVVACSGGLPRSGMQPAGSVTFSDHWPETSGSYANVAADWTRSDRIVRDYDRVLEVVAVFKSPEWRAAHLAHRAKLESLPDAEVARLAQSEQADSAEFYEVQLLVATYHHRENDLHKGENSVWRVALVDDSGAEILPLSIERDRRPRDVIGRYYPQLDDFHRVYVARFPRTSDLMRSDARQFSLKVAGARGSVALAWSRR